MGLRMPDDLPMVVPTSIEFAAAISLAADFTSDHEVFPQFLRWMEKKAARKGREGELRKDKAVQMLDTMREVRQWADQVLIAFYAERNLLGADDDRIGSGG
jgi:hypothetical protein